MASLRPVNWQLRIGNWLSWTVRFRNQMLDGLAVFVCFFSFVLSCIDASLTNDFYHWGFVYPAAAGLNQGLLPHRDIPVFYGIVTSALQALGLQIFGNNFLALGITTSIVYSLSLGLSYRVFYQLLDRAFALLGVLLLFLLHSYVVLPWANYFSYPFVLIAVLFLLGDRGYRDYGLAGLSIGISALARYTSVQATLPAFLCYFLYLALARQSIRRLKQKFVVFLIGLILPLGLFSIYLLFSGSLDAFLWHNQLMFQSAAHKNIGFQRHIINILFAKTPEIDIRSFIFSLIILANSLILVRGVLKGRSQQTQSASKWMLIALVTVFGTLNAFNHYEIFRLMNGSSIGLGLLLYIVQLCLRVNRNTGYVFLTALAVICFTCSNTAVFTVTSSDPWPSDPNLWRDGIKQHAIPILKGRILSKEKDAEYQKILRILNQLDSSYVVINYSQITLMSMITARSSPQVMSQYFLTSAATSLAEQQAIDLAIQNQKAIIFAMVLPPSASNYVSVAEMTPAEFSPAFQMYIPSKDQHLLSETSF